MCSLQVHNAIDAEANVRTSQHELQTDAVEYLRFAPKLPVHGPKQQRNANCEGEAGGIVGRRAPEGDEELLHADEVLPPRIASVFGVKVQRGDFRVWLTHLLDQLLLLPADTKTRTRSFYNCENIYATCVKSSLNRQWAQECTGS